MLKIITRKQRAAEAAERFKQQYGPKFEAHPAIGSAPSWDSRKLHEALLALGHSPTVEQVEAVMPGWTSITCDNCKQNVEAVAQLGDEPDYESSTAWACVECLESAIQQMRGEFAESPPSPAIVRWEPSIDAHGNTFWTGFQACGNFPVQIEMCVRGGKLAWAAELRLWDDEHKAIENADLDALKRECETAYKEENAVQS